MSNAAGRGQILHQELGHPAEMLQVLGKGIDLAHTQGQVDMEFSTGRDVMLWQKILKLNLLPKAVFKRGNEKSPMHRLTQRRGFAVARV